jgi:hypothetical protein
LDTATGQIRQVSTSRCHIEDGRGCNEKPRLAVALDYLHVMSGIKGKGGLGREGAIEVPLRFKPGYFAKTGKLEIVLSEQVKKLGCVEGVSFWVFEGESKKLPDGKRQDIKQWHRVDSTLSGTTLSFKDEDKVKLVALMGSAPRRGSTPALAWSPKSMISERPNMAQVTLGARRPSQAFCEVRLRKPESSKAPEDWATDMQCTEPWVFPVDIALIDGNVDLGSLLLNMDRSEAAYPAKAVWHFGRPEGERGEVPDWGFLALNFKDKGYVPAKDAIKMIA